MLFDELKDFLKNGFGIKKGDTLFVSSDVTMLLYKFHKNKEMLNLNDFIDFLQSLVGKNGNIIFPTYNWDFCSGKSFDYHKTPSMTGSLTNIALKRKDFKRTKHPIYSFAVWGKDKDYLTSLDYVDSFGGESIFAWFEMVKAKNIFINVPYVNSATFIHHIEQKNSVNYRYIKDFTANYIDKNGNNSQKTYSMFVRYLDKNVETLIEPMHEIFVKHKAVTESKFYDSTFRILDMPKAYKLVEEDIKYNNARRLASYNGQEGYYMYNLLKKLFPICRSITGNGVRETLSILKQECALLKTYEVPSGTKVFDWTIPKEWNIKDGWIKNSKGQKIIDFKENNLHIIGYSTPIHKKVNLIDLLQCIYTLPKQPDLIPYVTSYYKERYGFCMSENQKQSLQEDEYEIFIDSSLENGFLTYGEIIIPGRSKKEIFISTYICHPSMANNELSGPVVAINLAKWLSNRKNNKYTYRFVFIPETIGSITYLSKHIKDLQRNVIAGYVLTCVGDNNAYSYIPSRYGNTLADRAALIVLKHIDPNFVKYSFLDRGSDERQYCSPNVDLPICSITRTKYGDYSEYHTSGDNLDFISKNGLQGAYDVYKQIIKLLENNAKWKNIMPCEPQMGKRGLYPTTSMKGSTIGGGVEDMMNILAYTDGNNDIIDICNIVNVSPQCCLSIIDKLSEAGLIQKESNFNL